MFQHHQQVCLIGLGFEDALIQRIITRHGGKQLVELFPQRRRPLRRGSLLLGAQWFVEIPVALPKRFQPFPMLRHARFQALIMAPVVNPA